MFRIIRTKYASLNTRTLKALKQEYTKTINLKIKL